MLLPLAPLLLFELPQLLLLLPFDVPRPEEPEGGQDEDDPHHDGSVRHLPKNVMKALAR